MLKRYHQVVGGFFRAVDSCVIGGVWLLSYWLRFYLPLIQVTKGFPSFKSYAALTPLVMGIWWVVFSNSKIYGSNRLLRRTDEAFALLRAHLIAMLCFLSLTYMFSEYRHSRAVMAYFGLLGGVSLLVVRLTLRNFIRSLREGGFHQKDVLVVGEGKPLEHLLTRLKKFPELGLKVVGFISDSKSPLKSLFGIPRLGGFEDLNGLLKSRKIDQLLVALTLEQSPALTSILAGLKNEVVDITLVPEIYEFATLGCEIEDFDGIPLVNLNDSPLEGWGAIAKRITDFTLSLIALIVLFPFLMVIGILVKLTSAGPILYGQERMGLDGRTFKMWKFRSMRGNAEQATGAVWAVKNDTRRTPFGTFLRATSLDELPQLWNVLVGEMSLVGPRPERPVFVDQFKGQVPLYMLRHKVKAGLTGWAQVNGWRGDTSLDRRIECDLYYIRHWSYGFDLKIILMTFWKGFVNKNAY